MLKPCSTLTTAESRLRQHMLQSGLLPVGNDMCHCGWIRNGSGFARRDPATAAVDPPAARRHGLLMAALLGGYFVLDRVITIQQTVESDSRKRIAELVSLIDANWDLAISEQTAAAF